MATVFQWYIHNIECVKSQGDLTNIASTIHWNLSGNDEGTTASVYGATTIPEADPNNFISFDDLTEAQVISWLESALGSTLDQYKTRIQAEIDQLKAPAIINKTPPWAIVKPGNPIY